MKRFLTLLMLYLPFSAHAENGSACTGKEQDRISCLTQQIQRRSHDAALYFRRGVLYEESGSFDKAIADYGQVIVLSPSDTKAYFRRAKTFRKRWDAFETDGDVERSIADYTRVIEI